MAASRTATTPGSTESRRFPGGGRVGLLLGLMSARSAPSVSADPLRTAPCAPTLRRCGSTRGSDDGAVAALIGGNWFWVFEEACG